MAQFLRPDGDITTTNVSAGTFASIDESTASDTDFVIGTNNTTATYECSLSDPGSTPASGTCTVRFRHAKGDSDTSPFAPASGGTGTPTTTCSVIEGTTELVADATQDGIDGTWTQREFTFSTSLVTNWNDLRLRFSMVGTGGAAANRRTAAVSWAEIEAPDAAAGVTVTPGTVALSTATFAPAVTASDHKTVVPSTSSLTTSLFAPTVSVTNNIKVTPGAVSLSLTELAPTVSVSDHKTVVPNTAALITVLFAPSINVGVNVVPGTAGLTTSQFAPVIQISDHKTVVPGTTGLTLATFAPTVTGSSGVTVIPGVASLITSLFAPTVTASNHIVVTPGTAALSLTTFVPRILKDADDTGGLSGLYIMVEGVGGSMVGPAGTLIPA